MGFRAQFIDDPYPVWNAIRSRLADDTGNLVTVGDFLGVFENERMAGAFLIKRWNEHTYEIHGGVHPEYWGRGSQVVELAGRALFAGTPCLKIVAIIPAFNKLMRKCVTDLGMKQEGIVTKSFLKWMKMHDQFVYGITKGESRCLPQRSEQHS